MREFGTTSVKYDHRISTYDTKQTMDRVKRAASQRGERVADFIRRAVRRELEQHETALEAAARQNNSH